MKRRLPLYEPKPAIQVQSLMARFQNEIRCAVVTSSIMSSVNHQHADRLFRRVSQGRFIIARNGRYAGGSFSLEILAFVASYSW